MLGLLMPGSTIVVFAGFLAFHGKSSLVLLIPVSIAGALLGDAISFGLGLRYGSTLLKLRSFQRHHRLMKNQKIFVTHGGKSIFFARFLGPIRGITPFVAGLSGMPKPSFNIHVVISAVLWGISYPLLGYMGGQSWQKAQSLTVRFSLVTLGFLIAVLVHHWVRKNIKT